MISTVLPDWAGVHADPSRSASETELRLTQEDLVLLKRAEVAVGHDNATALCTTASARRMLQEQALDTDDQGGTARPGLPDQLILSFLQ